MSSGSDVRSTPHDRHDAMLVAALAAGDLAGTDRDQAIALTRSCAECWTLHEDLIALARATASAPPPIATRPRDFQLTPADAARLRPSGWRRVLGAFSTPRPRFARQAGVAFTTLGLVGLLVGNVDLSAGTTSTAGAPTSGAAPTAGAAPQASAAKAALEALPPTIATDRTSSDQGGGAESGASAAPVAVEPTGTTWYASSASAAPRQSDGSDTIVRGAAVPGSPTPTAPGAAPGGVERNGSAGSMLARTAEPTRPLNLLFVAAVVVGLVLLVASRLRSRRTS